MPPRSATGAPSHSVPVQQPCELRVDRPVGCARQGRLRREVGRRAAVAVIGDGDADGGGRPWRGSPPLEASLAASRGEHPAPHRRAPLPTGRARAPRTGAAPRHRVAAHRFGRPPGRPSPAAYDPAAFRAQTNRSPAPCCRGRRAGRRPRLQAGWQMRVQAMAVKARSCSAPVLGQAIGCCTPTSTTSWRGQARARRDIDGRMSVLVRGAREMPRSEDDVAPSSPQRHRWGRLNSAAGQADSA